MIVSARRDDRVVDAGLQIAEDAVVVALDGAREIAHGQRRERGAEVLDGGHHEIGDGVQPLRDLAGGALLAGHVDPPGEVAHRGAMYDLCDLTLGCELLGDVRPDERMAELHAVGVQPHSSCRRRSPGRRPRSARAGGVPSSEISSRPSFTFWR